ncbi:MAG: Holliday junction resolvase RuvX [Bacteroidetes bacterium HGW-Bacteroidetes-4]|jgi:putative Holliday junction resolvase|nr:MAG: Holliday junction resolvase RuvX [Bacteroidetes bacterium HGW-Bacteroidetes-4]
MGRILAIDYGKKRTGIAVTDTLQIIANGLTTVPSHEVLKFLKDYLQKEPVEAFVVGYARQMDHSDSESMQYIEPFVKQLVKHFPQLPVYRVDERFTSKMAFQTMIDGGLKKKQRQNKALVDTISATIILQSFMEQKARGLI